MKSKSSKNCFVGYPVKVLIAAVSSLEMFSWTLLKSFFIESMELREMFWKVSYQCLVGGKNLRLEQQYYE